MIPRFRAVPPSPAQLAADPAAPHILFVAADIGGLVLATGAIGLGLSREGDLARVVASRSQLDRMVLELRTRGLALADDLARYLSPERAWKLRTRSLELDRPYVMGILNLTNDSFSGDGVGRDVASALNRAEFLQEAGADIIDVGAETARADRPAVDPEEEAATVAPVIAALVSAGFLVSIDAYKPLVVRVALESGAEIVNDISGLTLGVGAAAEAARAGAGYVLNYSYSVPKRRPDMPPVYADVVTETLAWMEGRIEQLRAAGLADPHVALDPGIAFGKSHDEDLQMLRRIGEVRTFGLPLLLAHSRKNFIGSVSGRPPEDRDIETHAASVLAFEQGVRIFRVHDPAGTSRALELAAAIAAGKPGDYAPDGASWPWRAGSGASHMTRAESDKPAPPGQRW